MKFEFDYEFEGMNANHWVVRVTEIVNGKMISVSDVFDDNVSVIDVYSRMTDLIADSALNVLAPYM